MTKEIKKVVRKRIREMFRYSVVLSAMVCLLCITGPLPVGSIQRDIVLAILPIIYIVCNFLRLRKYYCKMKNDRKFYFVNIFAEAVFAIVSVLSYIVASILFSSMFLRKIYSWMFLVTYLFGFSNIEIPSIILIGLFHTVLFASIFVAPIGLGWIKYKKLEREEFVSRMPGKLDVNPLEKKTVKEVQNGREKEENTMS